VELAEAVAFWFAPTGQGDGELSKGQEYWQRGGERGRHAELREGLPEAISVNQLRRDDYGEDPSE
jgi:hypothetical protein